MNPKKEDEIKKQLASLMNSLKTTSLFPEDDFTWAADCIQSFLDGNEKTLDHAFGLRSSKRGPKQMESGKHEDWVVNAMQEVNKATPNGKEWPDTKTLARIGRYYGLGGKNNEYTEDRAVASELKRTIIRYDSITDRLMSEEITGRLNKADDG